MVGSHDGFLKSEQTVDFLKDVSNSNYPKVISKEEVGFPSLKVLKQKLNTYFSETL